VLPRQLGGNDLIVTAGLAARILTRPDLFLFDLFDLFDI
jgi:hypothetical protein